MHTAARETLLLETDLRKAVEKYEFDVEYQPIFSLETGEIEGVEALARWNHPTLGEIHPSKFIPLAEETGLIDPLGELVLDKACTEIGDVYDAIENDTFKLSVQSLVPAVRSAVSRAPGEEHSRQNRISSIPPEARDHRDGVLRVSGTSDRDAQPAPRSGYRYRHRRFRHWLFESELPCPAAYLDAQDRPHLRTARSTRTAPNTEIVRTIIAMAQNLDLKVIAEGIETPSQLDALKDLGCESGQGYLLARPMSADELLVFLGGTGEAPIPAPNFDDISMVSMLQ